MPFLAAEIVRQRSMALGLRECAPRQASMPIRYGGITIDWLHAAEGDWIGGKWTDQPLNARPRWQPQGASQCARRAGHRPGAQG